MRQIKFGLQVNLLRGVISDSIFKNSLRMKWHTSARKKFSEGRDGVCSQFG